LKLLNITEKKLTKLWKDQFYENRQRARTIPIINGSPLTV